MAGRIRLRISREYPFPYRLPYLTSRYPTFVSSNSSAYFSSPSLSLLSSSSSVVSSGISFSSIVSPSPLTLVASSIHTVPKATDNLSSVSASLTRPSLTDDELINLFIAGGNPQNVLKKNHTTTETALIDPTVSLSLKETLRLYPLLQELQQIGGIELPSPNVYLSLLTRTITQHTSLIDDGTKKKKENENENSFTVPPRSSIDRKHHAALTFEAIMFLFDRIQEHYDVPNIANSKLTKGKNILNSTTHSTSPSNHYFLPKKDLYSLLYTVGIPLILATLEVWPSIAIIDITYRLSKVCEYHIDDIRHRTLLPNTLPVSSSSPFFQLWSTITTVLQNRHDNPLSSYTASDLHHTLVGLAKLKLFLTRLNVPNEFRLDIFHEGQHRFHQLLAVQSPPPQNTSYQYVNGQNNDRIEIDTNNDDSLSIEMIMDILNALYTSGTLTQFQSTTPLTSLSSSEPLLAYEALLLPSIQRTINVIKKLPKQTNISNDNNKNNSSSEIDSLRKSIHRYFHLGYVLLYSRLYRRMKTTSPLSSVSTTDYTDAPVHPDILRYNHQLVNLWNIAEEKFLIPPSSVQDMVYSFILLQYLQSLPTESSSSFIPYTASSSLIHVPEFTFESLPVTNNKLTVTGTKHPMVRITNKRTGWTIIVPWRPIHPCIDLCTLIRRTLDRSSASLPSVVKNKYTNTNLEAVLALSVKKMKEKKVITVRKGLSDERNDTVKNTKNLSPPPSRSFWIEQLLSLKNKKT